MTRGLAPFFAAVTAAALACAQEIEEPDEADLGELYFGSGDHVTANGIQRMHVAANQIVLDPVRRAAFISQSLPTTLADPTLQFDPFTSTFLRYVAQCALEPGQALTYYNETFHGALGLCTSWHDEAPSSRCLEAVSGCLLGLNNKLGVRVPVSPRGRQVDGGSLSVAGPIQADSMQPPESGFPQLIASFGSSCGGPAVGANRNCNWRPERAVIGVCEYAEPPAPPALVEVGVGASVGCGSPLGSASGNPVVRACRGMKGCDAGSPDMLAVADDTCTNKPAVVFPCPSSGAFTVMVGGFNEAVPYTAVAAAESLSGAEVIYPADADDAFPVREGAFYGNLFASLNPKVHLTGSPTTPVFQVDPAGGGHTGWDSPELHIFEDAWACHDPAWDPHDAYLHARLCAVQQVLRPDDDGNMVWDDVTLCMARSLGPCNDVAYDDPGNRCLVLDGSPVGDGDYDRCRGGAPVSKVGRAWPMTVFLHDSCDLLPASEHWLCDGSHTPQGHGRP